MKYIKKYEVFNDFIDIIPKFNINDPVKIIGDNSNIIYAVDGYDYDRTEKRTLLIKNMCRLRKYEDIGKFASEEGFYSWIIENKLKHATPEEIEKYKIKLTANKYNL